MGTIICIQDPVLPIMLHAPLLLFWFSWDRGVYCLQVCSASWAMVFQSLLIIETQKFSAFPFSSSHLLLRWHFSGSLEDYALLEKLNKLTVSKYCEMSDTAKTLITAMEELDKKCKSMQEIHSIWHWLTIKGNWWNACDWVLLFLNIIWKEWKT